MSQPTRKRILSGIKPTNGLTLGNYIGALKPWVDQQNDAENFYMIADSHAITVYNDPVQLREATWELAAAYIASGLDPQRNAFFLQSHVPSHLELGWILTCQSPMGWMSRMTQFKDKAGKNRDSVGAGLFVYPALMAADILIYDATHVPVGDDQKQHVELTRDLALAFNRQFGEIFTVPEPVIPKVGARIRSLRDGTKKMSKSDLSDMSRINMTDNADVIADKIRRAKTDTGTMPVVGENLDERPEIANLLEIYSILDDKPVAQLVEQFQGGNFAPFKEALAERIIHTIVPIGEEMARLLADKVELGKMLAIGRDKAAAVADKKLAQVKDAMGFVAAL